MDSETVFPSSSKNPAPLFPAYSAEDKDSKKADEKEKDEKDWLYNASFTQDNYEAAVLLHESFQKSETLTEEKKQPHKKSKERITKKKQDKKYVPPPKHFDVPESDSIWSHMRKKTFIEDTGLSFERAFRVDINCDPENITFDSFEQKNIAKYKLRHRMPFGILPEEQNMWSQELPKKKEKDVIRYFGKRALKFFKNINLEEILCDLKRPLCSDALDYIPLPVHPNSVTNKEQGALKVVFDGVSVDWKLKQCQPHITEEKLNETKLEQNEMQARTIKFNKNLSESPDNIDMWLDFVNFQNELWSFQEENSSNYFVSEADVVEKKIAILDKALKYNPKSVKLHIAKLNLCQNIFKIEKLIALWNDLIFLNPNNYEVWQAYLQFTLTNIMHFNTSHIVKLYSKCLRTFSNLSEGIIETHEPPPDIIPVMIDIFSQLCFVLKNCGYIEWAIASFQALVEFNLFCDHTALSLSVSEQIDCFEPFWDSGAPRIGEDDAIGWITTVLEKKAHTDKISSESDLNNNEDEILYQKLPEWRTWLEFEKLRETYHWLPWKPNPLYDQTNDDIDDVDRTVPFEKISKFLFRIVDEEHKFLLVVRFLTFLNCNFHLFGCKNAINRTAYNQINIENYQILSQKLIENLFPKKLSNPLCFKLHNWTTDKFNFVNNIFSQVIEKFSVKHKILLSFLWLKFRRSYLNDTKDPNFTNNIEDLKTFAKNMLKKSENRNCLVLWCEYIKIEKLTSKSRAKKTFEMLLTSSSAAAFEGSMNFSELWYFIRYYIECYIDLDKWDSGDCGISSDEIIWILIQLGCKEKFTPYSNQAIKPALILKAVAGFKYILGKELQSLSSGYNALCYCVDPGSFSVLDCIKCFAYLRYFTQGLDAGLEIYKDTSECIGASTEQFCKEYLSEQMCVFQAELLNFHTWKSNVGIKPLQSYLYDSIKTFSSNSELLLYLVKLRSASCVMGPTRRFFVKILKQSIAHHPITWIFALASELSILYSISEYKYFETDQLNYFGSPTSCWGINWKIRSLYEKAVHLPSCMYNPFFWRSYVKFEMFIGDMERAKGIFHRGMQNCGWSKELLLDGIECFPDDLKQILDFMIEKQIRTHTPLEEVTLLMEHAVQDP